jgi:hypothetical protein
MAFRRRSSGPPKGPWDGMTRGAWTWIGSRGRVPMGAAGVSPGSASPPGPPGSGAANRFRRRSHSSRRRAQSSRATAHPSTGLPGLRKGRGVSTASPARKTPHSGTNPTRESGVCPGRGWISRVTPPRSRLTVSRMVRVGGMRTTWSYSPGKAARFSSRVLGRESPVPGCGTGLLGVPEALGVLDRSPENLARQASWARISNQGRDSPAVPQTWSQSP